MNRLVNSCLCAARQLWYAENRPQKHNDNKNWGLNRISRLLLATEIHISPRDEMKMNPSIVQRRTWVAYLSSNNAGSRQFWVGSQALLHTQHKTFYNRPLLVTVKMRSPKDKYPRRLYRIARIPQAVVTGSGAGCVAVSYSSKGDAFPLPLLATTKWTVPFVIFRRQKDVLTSDWTPFFVIGTGWSLNWANNAIVVDSIWSQGNYVLEDDSYKSQSQNFGVREGSSTRCCRSSLKQEPVLRARKVHGSGVGTKL